MSYLVNKTDGSLLTTVADTTRDTTSSDLSFIGKGFVGYGETINENFVKLLENFNDTSPPPRAIDGQFWYNRTAKRPAIHTANGFKYLARLEAGTASPTGTMAGDLWFDTTQLKLKVYNGTAFVGVAENIDLNDVNILGNLAVVGTSTLGTIEAGTITTTSTITTPAVNATALTGSIQTASQTNITTVGTLTALSVAGNISGATNLTVTGNITASGQITGTLATAVQTNITSIGTLGNLNVTGNTATGNASVSGNVTVSGKVTGSKTNNILPVYNANQTTFPSANTYEGAMQYSKSDDRVYFADGSTWKALAKFSDIGSVTLGNLAQQNSNAVTITGGNIDGTNIGSTTAANATFANVSVTGNLTVTGTTTYLNTTTSTIKDPVIVIGGSDSGASAASDDNKDRGIQFQWHNGTSAKSGFFGYDDSASAFTFIADATNTSEVFSGSAGDVVFGNASLGNASITAMTTTANLTVSSVASITGRATVSKALVETFTVESTAAATSKTFDLTTNTYFYITADATNNITPNFTNLNTVCAVNDSVTVTLIVTNGATPYKITALEIGGASQTIKWISGTAPATGAANALDVYTFTVLRLSASYVVLGSYTSYS